ncbi:hypothetical protein EW026_g2130 [Hermanssonia centrifuga]|uniref:Protein kinase domain-containing protein n=1 Tax=Hermanssonia centrifuga TaxID=98765 RepID=A0A4S4KPA7_9APHY|nr:hypothetical protein EW026_g2130 [Hermanssonia centrifuga]
MMIRTLSPPPPPPPQQQQQRQPREQTREQPRDSSQQQQTQKAQAQKYKEELEQIVQEEREAKGKMPTYKGLENFRLIDKMGDGAFSNVYKAVDIHTGQRVAVKVVRKYELSASQAGDNKHLNKDFKKKPRVTERANILKEVQIMRGINHPAIVKLLSFSESEEHYFLVLELLEGGELFHQIVKLTYFSENLARHVILQVAHGIHHLHEERGVVHRDIKPENLLFERIPIRPSRAPQSKQFEEDKEDEGEFIPGVGGGGIGRVKIADFGLSKVVWDEQTMTPCGTVGYTAPEIVKDERYSKSVDIINVLTEKVARGYYTFLSPWWDGITASAKDLISHLLCVDPAQRYTIDEFLNHPWCKAAPAPPPPPTPGQELRDIPLDSPLLAAVRGGREVRSPGLATLKEAFDITYAVHRMEEEGARRRAAKGGANRGFLGGLNEEDEEESFDEDEHVVAEARQRHGEQSEAVGQSRTRALPQVPQGTGAKESAKRALQGNAHAQPDTSVYDGRAGQRDRGARRSGNVPFELDMDAATLLGRRHRRGVDSGMGLAFGGSPLAQSDVGGTFPENPGSPMRID